jgi:ribonuclease VapC
MIVDSSALIAILRREPDRDAYARAIASADRPRMSAASYLEVGIVVDRDRNPIASRRVDDLISEASIEIAPVTDAQIRIARSAYRDFGKGSGHPARLNFGDCFAYALAKDLNETLLFKGDDFIHTDVRNALEQPGR